MLGDELITIERTVESIDNKGRPIEGATSIFENEKASVQPLSGQELLLLPEGERIRQNLWLYTTFDILIDDIVIRNNKNYTTMTVEDWNYGHSNLSHYRARIMLVEGQNG